MNRQFYTYLHCKPNGDPFYVGKGSGRRAYSFYRRNAHHRAIVAKHGARNIRIYVFPCESEDEALSDEVRQIAQLRRDGFRLANITDGGDGVSGLSKPVLPAQREKLRAASMGNKNALGWRHTAESRKRLSEGQKRRADYAEIPERLRQVNQKRVICLDTGEVFESATIAARIFGMKDKSSVTQCCRGVSATAYGKKFRYLGT